MPVTVALNSSKLKKKTVLLTDSISYCHLFLIQILHVRVRHIIINYFILEHKWLMSTMINCQLLNKKLISRLLKTPSNIGKIVNYHWKRLFVFPFRHQIFFISIVVVSFQMQEWYFSNFSHTLLAYLWLRLKLRFMKLVECFAFEVNRILFNENPWTA